MTFHTVLEKPSTLGRDTIYRYIGETRGGKFLHLAECGFHIHNPYHNLSHELGVVYYAFSAYINQAHTVTDERTRKPALLNIELYELLIAALFHDHNHSGGKTSDHENINRALDFTCRDEFIKVFGDDGLSSVSIERVRENIRVTEYQNGKFTHQPKTLAQRAIRDADLMSIYSKEGRNLLHGLFIELGIKDIQKNTAEERAKVLNSNAEFLRGAQMYTTHGANIKYFQLEDAIAEFNKGFAYMDDPLEFNDTIQQ